MLHDKLDIYFLQNVHQGTSATGKIRLSIILRHSGLGQYNWIFFNSHFNTLRDTLAFRFGAWM